MEDEKKQTAVYVGEDDEIVEIIEKIRNAHSTSVTLVVPKESAILQDVTNLKLLQKRAEELGKDVSISKASFGMESLAGVQMPQEKKSARPRNAGSLTAGAHRPMDMVHKAETIDLRNVKVGHPEEVSVEEEPQEPEKPMDIPVVAPKKEEYSRNKYFSDEAFSQGASEKKISTPLLSEIKDQDAEEEKDQEVESILKSARAKQSGEEQYWENLAEKKMSERGDADEKLERLLEERTKAEQETENKTFDFSYPEFNKKKKKKFSLLPSISARFFAIFILLGLLTAAVALFFVLPKADIAVALKQEDVKGDFTLALDSKATAVDVDNDKVPMKTTEIKSEKTQTFTTTSKKRVTEKATGEITVMNECSTGPQTLVAGTRFLAKDGKVFKTTEAINIPGFTKPEDAIVPGQKAVKVEAEVAGEDYNIAATTFTIPKLQEQGSWKYSCLYGQSFQAMAGGSDKEVAYVSQSDYDQAKSTLLAAAQKENDEKVSSQEGTDAIYLNDKTDTGTVEEKSSLAVGAIGDSFDMTVAVKRNVLSIAKSDLDDILGKKILAMNTYQDAKPVDGSLEYTVGDLVDKDKTLSVGVNAKESFAFEIDQDKIKKEISGMNKQELNDYFAKMSGIRSVSVNFWPFWVNRVPESYDKINITVG